MKKLFLSWSAVLILSSCNLCVRVCAPSLFSFFFFVFFVLHFLLIHSMYFSSSLCYNFSFRIGKVSCIFNQSDITHFFSYTGIANSFGKVKINFNHTTQRYIHITYAALDWILMVINKYNMRQSQLRAIYNLHAAQYKSVRFTVYTVHVVTMPCTFKIQVELHSIQKNGKFLKIVTDSNLQIPILFHLRQFRVPSSERFLQHTYAIFSLNRLFFFRGLNVVYSTRSSARITIIFRFTSINFSILISKLYHIVSIDCICGFLLVMKY